jgi:hypothetical protein
VRCAQRAQQRTRALTVPEPNVALLFGVGIAPTDGTRLPIVGSGEFGMSPFFGQLWRSPSFQYMPHRLRWLSKIAHRSSAIIIYSLPEWAVLISIRFGNLNKKLLSYATENVTAAVGLVQKLSRAKNLEDVVKIQTEFMSQQLNSFNEQTKTIVELCTKAAQGGTKRSTW